MVNAEEASHLLNPSADADHNKAPAAPPKQAAEVVHAAVGWTAEGLPLGHGSVVGEPIARVQWDSSLFACLGRNDEFCSSDLEGSCEALSRSCGCCGGVVEDDIQREQLESACDFATHFFCHSCSLCQEGRELRRRLPHPGFTGRSVFVMIPPAEQMMGRGA